jgi:hypothetical protein
MKIKLQRPERTYYWVAEYKDGKTVTKDKCSFKEVLEANGRGEINRFALVPLTPKLKEIIINLTDNRRLIYFERTIGNTGDEFEAFLVYLLGWQETVKGVNKKYIMYIYPNGNIEVNNDEATLIENYITKEKQNGRQ